ncbi:MAG: universal stress protein [Thermoanaerobaculia bacterium]|nr:universal stress protein [Thermoanaerobaculia bacterium]
MSQHLKNIVVGTSLEMASDCVVRTAYEIARRSGAELHILHAHALPVAYFAAPSGLTTVSADLLDGEREVRRQLFDQQLERLGLLEAGLREPVIEAGAAHRMMLETARSVDADLVVVGSAESEGLPLLGSTADRVLRGATCPVWVVEGEPRMPPRKVLAPVDLSPLSEESLCRGLTLLDEIDDPSPQVECLFVVTRDELEGSRQFTPDQIRRLAHEELDSFLERVDRDARRRIRPEVREGDIRAEILRDVEEHPIDLVIVGTHGRSGFERFLLGSVAADIAARARVSVLVIPPDKADTDD